MLTYEYHEYLNLLTAMKTMENAHVAIHLKITK